MNQIPRPEYPRPDFQRENWLPLNGEWDFSFDEPIFDWKILVPFACETKLSGILVCSALICLIELGQLPSWMVIIIVSREFIISGFRLIAAEQGIVIAASYWGKFKTTFQMIAVILMIVDLPVLHILTVACTWIALVLTVVSLVDYIAKNHKVLTEGAI